MRMMSYSLTEKPLLAGVWFCIFALLLSCASVSRKSKSPALEAQDQFQKAYFFEASGTDAVILRCHGIGPDRALAAQNARLSCIDWFAKSYLLITQEQLNAYLRLRAEILSKVDNFVSNPTQKPDAKGLGIHATLLMPDGKIKIEIMASVDKTMLKKELVRLGILSTQVPVLPLVLVLSEETKSLDDTKAMLQSLESVLLQEQWTILPSPVDASDGADSGKRLSSVEMTKLVAEKAGAKLGLLIEAKKDLQANRSVSFSVTLTAIEATSGTKIGTVASLSAPRASFIAGETQAAMMEAAKDAVTQLLPSLERFRVNAGK